MADCYKFQANHPTAGQLALHHNSWAKNKNWCETVFTRILFLILANRIGEIQRLISKLGVDVIYSHYSKAFDKWTEMPGCQWQPSTCMDKEHFAGRKQCVAITTMMAQTVPQSPQCPQFCRNAQLCMILILTYWPGNHSTWSCFDVHI